MGSSYFWVKIPHAWLDNPDIGMLPSDELRWRYLQLYLQAGEFYDEGALPPTRHMAYRFRCSVGELEQALGELAQAGLLQLRDDGTWFVVNYASEQAPVPDAKRKAQSRQREREAALSQGSHKPVTVRDTDKIRSDKIRSDEIREEAEASAAAAAALPGTEPGNGHEAAQPEQLEELLGLLSKERGGQTHRRLERGRMAELVKEHGYQVVKTGLAIAGDVSRATGSPLTMEGLSGFCEGIAAQGAKGEREMEI